MENLATDIRTDYINKPALLILDMTQGFTSKASPLGVDSDKAIQAMQRLISTFRLSALPICYTCLEFDDESSNVTFRAYTPELNIFKPGSQWVELDPRLERLPEEPIFKKTAPSGFYGTNLEAWLVLNEIESLVIAGVTANGSVRATVFDGLNHDYRIWVAEDACNTSDAFTNSSGLRDLDDTFAVVTTTDSIISAVDPIQPLDESDYI